MQRKRITTLNNRRKKQRGEKRRPTEYESELHLMQGFLRLHRFVKTEFIAMRTALNVCANAFDHFKFISTLSRLLQGYQLTLMQTVDSHVNTLLEFKRFAVM
jgi:hypothetical protein